jgi:transcriptional regulator with XRE-family HTH domain
MVERIREILSTRQLTPTQFADAIGVARPIVSHILSGRNKPSLEVVQKVIASFPDLSLPWLLSGNGPMVAATTPQAANQAPVAAESPVKSPKTPLAEPFEPAPDAIEAADTRRPPADIAQARNVNQLEPFADPQPAVPVNPMVEPLAALSQAPTQSQSATTVAPAGVGASPAPAAHTKPAEPMLQAFADPGKSIRRIVIFYHDGTFSDFRPEPAGA